VLDKGKGYRHDTPLRLTLQGVFYFIRGGHPMKPLNNTNCLGLTAAIIIIIISITIIGSALWRCADRGS
jgi:hypothetical protein